MILFYFFKCSKTTKIPGMSQSKVPSHKFMPPNGRGGPPPNSKAYIPRLTADVSVFQAVNLHLFRPFKIIYQTNCNPFTFALFT